MNRGNPENAHTCGCRRFLQFTEGSKPESDMASFLESTGGVDPQHACKNSFLNLGGPAIRRAEPATQTESKGVESQEFRSRHSTDEMSNDHGGKGVTERSRVSEDTGATHRGGKSDWTQRQSGK